MSRSVNDPEKTESGAPRVTIANRAAEASATTATRIPEAAKKQMIRVSAL